MIQYDKECPCGCGCVVKFNSNAVHPRFSGFAKKALRLFGIGLLKSCAVLAAIISALVSVLVPIVLALYSHPLWILIYVVHFAILYAALEWSNHK